MSFSARRISVPKVLPPARKVVPAVHVGTAYELATLAVLSSAPYHMHLLRVGGANDKGIDLRGRWAKFQVVVQCKAEQVAVRPATVREFEGVVAHEQRQQRRHVDPAVVGIVVSLAGFSRESLNRSFESVAPLSLVHLDAARQLVSWSRNPAWIRLVGGDTND